MSQQYPNPQNQPQWSGEQHPPQGQPPQYGQPQYGQPQPGQPAAYPPPPPHGQHGHHGQPPRKSWFARHKILTVIGGVLVVSVIGGIASGGGDDKPATDTAAVAKPAGDADGDAKAQPKPAGKAPAKKLSQADQFKAFVTKSGSAPEKAAVTHVTKVQGAEEQNDILDAADVYTDFTGGIAGPHANEAKLLASAFADWKDSDNGLVTIYDKSGEILANGNF